MKIIAIGAFAGLSWGVTIADVRNTNLRLPMLGPIAFLIAFVMLPIVLVVPLVYGAERKRLMQPQADRYGIIFSAAKCAGLSACAAIVTATLVLGLLLVI